MRKGARGYPDPNVSDTGEEERECGAAVALSHGDACHVDVSAKSDNKKSNSSDRRVLPVLAPVRTEACVGVRLRFVARLF